MTRLSTIAHGRSGDKGDHANIAIIAYTEAGYRWLCEHLTPERVQAFFQALAPRRVERFEVPNLRAVNFMLYHVLAGGASRSLRSDSQGKTFALKLLHMPIDLPADITAFVRPSTPLEAIP